MGLSYDDLKGLPDDVKIDLGDGKAITLGEIRGAAEEHVNKRIADLTPREQKLVSREQALQAAEEQVRRTMEQLANTPPPQQTVTTQPVNVTGPQNPFPDRWSQEQWEAIRRDPYAAPLVMTMAALAEKSERLEKAIQDRDLTEQQRRAADAQLQETNWINYQLEQLSGSDPRYKDPNERRALLEFAQDSIKKRDMTVIHKARTYDTAVKDAEERGYKRGLEERQAPAPVPSIVHGTRTPPVAPEPEKLPASFTEFADQAANDQSLIQEIREAAATPHPVQ